MKKHLTTQLANVRLKQAIARKKVQSLIDSQK
jgi:hypothetical protein